MYIRRITNEDIQNIIIGEGNIVLVDSDNSFKHIEIMLLCGFEHNMGYSFDEWTNVVGSEKIKENYINYISSVVYECVIGGVSAIL